MHQQHTGNGNRTANGTAPRQAPASPDTMVGVLLWTTVDRLVKDVVTSVEASLV